MPLEISFTLDEQDLDYFRDVMVKAQEGAAQLSESEVVQRAQVALDGVRANARAPQFVHSRLDHLQSLISMLDDSDWPLSDEERVDVISALAYFYDPQDMIDDSLPVLGLLDDAIMIELVVREMRSEIEAYEEFLRYRTREEAKAPGRDISREDWLQSKRLELMDKMRERMSRRHRGAGGGRFTRFSFLGG